MEKKFAVVLSNLHKTFPGSKGPVHAVRGVNLEVPQGQIFGFLGPNGAGKTTTLRIITTLLPFEKGEVFVAGVDVKKDPQEVRKRIGYVDQKGGGDLSATGWENLILQGRLYGLSKERAVTQAKPNPLLKVFLFKSVSTALLKPIRVDRKGGSTSPWL